MDDDHNVDNDDDVQDVSWERAQVNWLCGSR